MTPFHCNPRQYQLKQIFYIILLFIPGLLDSSASQAQKDSILLKNRDIIAGEIKTLKKGVVTIETDYSDKDFLIEWTGVSEIYSRTRFLLTLRDGTRMNGFLTTTTDKKIKIIEDGDSEREVAFDELVYLKELKGNFWSRTKANIDMGFTLTKANNLRQLNLGSKASYTADKWTTDIYYNVNNSSQDSVNPTKRTDAGLKYTYYLQHGMFAASSLNFLSNTEQSLKLRTTAKAGLGKFLVQTNRSYWAVGGGLTYNNESFENETKARNSAEIYVGTEANLFDIGDFNFLGNLNVYRSLTESGRWRSDLKLDAKYDLPWDFYIKLNYTLNYDNRPAVEGTDFDYVFGLAFGWEL